MRTRHTEQPLSPDAKPDAKPDALADAHPRAYPGTDARADPHAGPGTEADGSAGGGTEQDALELRAELDELLRARQYAAQRERRLVEALRALPERQQPDGESLRQLSQARTLREGLGARCLELSDQLKVLEDRLRQPAPRRRIPRQPTGARFGGGAYEEAPAPSAPPTHPSAPPVPPPPRATGARFGRLRAAGSPEATGPVGPAAAAEETATATPPPPPPAPSPAPAPAPAPPPAGEPPRRRSAGELTALAGRITALYQQAGHQQAPQHQTGHHQAGHRQAAPQEAEALLARAADHLTPSDTAQLAALLARRGPAGTSVLLARSAARGAPERAAATLAELRQAGLAEEATELFHALWSYPVTALPALLGALERAGQHADGATLLWEWGSAPTSDLAALATRLHEADRAADARTLLRQAASRSSADLVDLVGALAAPLPALLLGEAAALRPPGELVRLAAALSAAGLRQLYDELLTALLADTARHRTTLAALRTAGLPTTPAPPPRSRWGRR
ncbi:hypothetical protein [Kitasatospora sp. NBC_00458]|uniref:hypothetical protein n=1 Tax=Kitasatospora sp. NBC_00458 TaxID=2903568 RepID=UPI002E190311